MKSNFSRLTLLVVLCAAVATAMGADPDGTGAAAVPANPPARYTFSWPLDGANPAPRGGSTRGPVVTSDTRESSAWHALREPGLRSLERDRRAILAIAGEYRATFDFLEIATFMPGAGRDQPYQSWGTERVYVDEDRGTFISLVHILEMRVIGPDGTISEPMVQKHWREDWQYEPPQLAMFAGDDHWRRRRIPAHARRGRWSQTVEQTDESPRYAGVGRWQHSPDFSTWISNDTWRPLPRRESRRRDYQVLLGTNRVTVGPTGWIQEENNLKTVLTADRTLDPAHPYLAREYGVARYERLRDADFAAATQYFERTRAFWHRVHTAWRQLLQANAEVALHEPSSPDNGPYAKLSEYADQLASGHAPAADETELIRAALRDVGANVGAQAGSALLPGDTRTAAAAALPSPVRGNP